MLSTPRFAFGLLIAVACGTTASQSSGPGAQGPLAAASASDAPAHVFTPRAHPARVHAPPPAPDIARLPPLIDRTRECFESPVRRPPKIATPPRRRSKANRPKKSKRKRKRKGSGYVPYEDGRRPGSAGVGALGGASGASSKTAKPQPKPKSRRDGNRNNAPAAEPEPEPAPVATASPPPSVSSTSPDPTADAGAADEQARNQPTQVGLADDTRSAPLQQAAADPDDQYRDWGSAIYLSNDDTMSLSSAQRVIFAIDHFLPLPAAHIRPHELLNYFSFDLSAVGPSDDFSVHAAIAPDPEDNGVYTLALGVRGRPMSVDDRRNANLAFVVDRSGSMAAEGRMEYLKRGLTRSLDQLKRGDIVHLVMFDHQVCTPIENFVVGRDSPQLLRNAIARLQPKGGTDLHAGLTQGYAIADRSYQPTHSNRVVMVTDAQVNHGITDEELIATVSKFYDRRQIRLSGVGVGSDFNDSLLDRLTERGRGAYVFLGSSAEVDAVFGPRFVSLIETTAVDVHFQLHLPPSLRMNVFYGEESSTVKEDVQAIHYFANTSQLFLSDLMARGGTLRDQDSIMLTIEYDEPESGEAHIEEYAFTLGEIQAEARNVAKGRLIMHFVDGLAWMASRSTPNRWGEGAGRWEDRGAWDSCEQGRVDLARMSQPIADDPEVRRVLGLWDKYCARYSRPREPVRRAPADDTWPSAAE